MTYPKKEERLVLTGTKRKTVTRCAKDVGEFAWLRANACVELPNTDAVAEFPPVTSSGTAAAIFRSISQAHNLWVEHVSVLCLDSKNAPLGVFIVHLGGRNSSIVDVGVVLQHVIIAGSVGFILCHNHPSGDPTPSPDDHEITDRLKAAAKLCNLALLDHIVLGRDSYTSFRDRHLL
jgi:DNA repair protein RadC